MRLEVFTKETGNSSNRREGAFLVFLLHNGNGSQQPIQPFPNSSAQNDAEEISRGNISHICGNNAQMSLLLLLGLVKYLNPLA